MERRPQHTRREFLTTVASAVTAAGIARGVPARAQEARAMDDGFYVQPGELDLRLRRPPPARRLSFARRRGSPKAWQQACRRKLGELLGFSMPDPCPVRLLRTARHEGVTVEAWVMDVEEGVSIPAYLLSAADSRPADRAVMAIHGHGDAEACIGRAEDYHHAFALRLAQAGHRVLCPALRGFGALADMAWGDANSCLDYWAWTRGPQFTLVTDGFLHGRTLIGETVEDLIRWEMWLAGSMGIRALDVAGISYGGDVALTYPAFSRRVRRIYASGSLGSFAVIFSQCYNAPAHCVPGVLQWMDRSDIAGLSAPRPIRLHYGELDTIGPRNNSASYNHTVQPALDELRAIYRAFGAESAVSLRVTPGAGHEMENDDLIAFLGD